MGNSALYFFVDTNLLIQCKPLEQLDWSPWKTFEEVRLIVSSPVLREIDHRKNKGNDRAGSRARATSAMFREMLSRGQKIVHPNSPRVVLSVEPQHTCSQELKHRLNYQERDDQLVGTVYEFAQRHQDAEVRLLTHDTTPLFTARALSLKADAVSEDWLLPPETNEAEKELASLKAENVRLKKTEPSISIQCKDWAGSKIECYRSSYTQFEPLTERQIDGLMQRLKDNLPPENDFGPRESAERAVKQTGLNIVLSTKEVYTPASDEEIAKYRDDAYPQWLMDCKQMLRNHHWTLQRRVPVLGFSFFADNVGTRPATDALITFEARGNFRIRPPSPDDQDEERDGKCDDGDDVQSMVLPRPPVAPFGEWKQTIAGKPGDVLRAFDELARSILQPLDLARGTDHILNHPMLDAPLSQAPSHDPNAFYYKSDRPSLPQSLFCLTCDQWRHDDGVEPFRCEIHVPTNQENAEGALVCRIHAANLSKPVSKLIPIRIGITPASAFESAQKIVEALLRTSISPRKFFRE